MKGSEMSNPQAVEVLYDKISMLIESTRRQLATAINVVMVYTNYEIGRSIVEEELQGASRAEYGKATLKELSNRLSQQFGNGYSYPNLKRIRQFYVTYSNKFNSVEPIETEILSGQTVQFTLSWSHYLVLMRIENPEERNFYEIECNKQNWSVRQLNRQLCLI